MLILAQAGEAGNGILDLFDRYGIAWGMLALFVVATIYILRRLLNDNNGILTGYVRSTIDQQKQLADTVRDQAATDAKVAQCLEASEQRLAEIQKTVERVETMHYNPHSQFATATLGRCFRHGCEVLEHISTKLEIDDKCKPLLDVMRRELDSHNQHVEGDAPPQ